MSTFHMSQNPSAHRRTALLAAITLALLFVLLSSTPNAFAGAMSLDSSKTTATIAPSICIEYDASSMKEALWNHGYFYVYFFQGVSNTSYSSATASLSSIATRKYTVAFKDGVSWAKVHIAAVDSSTSTNGAKTKRLKNSSGSELNYSDYLAKSRKFYVWISDSGGTLGEITLRGTTTRTVYAGAYTYKNAKTITVSSQLGADSSTQGSTESGINDIINIPFNWTGKQTHQVPYKEIRDKGVASSGKNTFYRLNWRQYSDGTTNEGYSPYKLQHDSSSAYNMWASVNLGAVGLTAVPTYKDSTLSKRTTKVYRNYNTTLGISLKRPSEQLLIDSNGGVLTKGSSSYSGSSIEYASKACASSVTLPTTGYKMGKDGTKTGYTLSGYTWTKGSNRSKFASASPSTTKKFVPFDQAKPQTVSAASPTVSLCNSWQMTAFSSTNSAKDSEDMLPTIAKASVTYKAAWTPKTFKIHYEVDGVETKVESKQYDSPYTIDTAPQGTSGWSITKEDGTPASAQGYMPSQDIYVSTYTPACTTVSYHINGKVVAAHTIPFGAIPLASSPQKGIAFNNDGVWDVQNCAFRATYFENSQSKAINEKYAAPTNAFGGTLSCWFVNEECTVDADDLIPVGPNETIDLYAYTTHTIHLWMDVGARNVSFTNDSDREKFCCLHELRCKYGDEYLAPTDEAASRAVTRPGCEDWLANNGKWYRDGKYKIESAAEKCTGDSVLYSFNVAKLSYELTDYAKELDSAEGGSFPLFQDYECTVSGTMRSFLPSSSLYRYGDEIAVRGDGQLYRQTGPESARSLRSTEGAYLTSGGTGEIVEQITLTKTTTVFKDWVQSIYDGVITG